MSEPCELCGNPVARASWLCDECLHAAAIGQCVNPVINPEAGLFFKHLANGYNGYFEVVS